MKKKINQGKSRCCKAMVNYTGGGYDGKNIVPVETNCTECGKKDPRIIRKVGRPVKVPF